MSHFFSKIIILFQRIFFLVLKLRSRLFARLLLFLPKLSIRELHDNPSVPGRKKRLLATMFLYANYQRPYLFHLANSIKALGKVEVRNIDISEEIGLIKRSLLAARNHGVAFHSFPFHTGRYPGTLHHVFISHGIDSGRYDELGSFCFGAGRMLGTDKNKKYDFILVSSAWSQEMAHIEVPEYDGRVLVVGDWRADAVIRAGSNPVETRALLGVPDGVAVVGIVTSHGSHSTFRRFGHQLLDTIISCPDNVIFMIFFHEYERVAQPDLFEAVQQYCKANKNVRIAADELFETSVAACDLLISDYGSTSLYYSLLGRPMAFLPFDESFMLPDFPTMTLRPHVHAIRTLADAVPLIHEVTDSNNDLLRPPQWFIQRLYPKGDNFSELSKKALETVFQTYG